MPMTPDPVDEDDAAVAQAAAEEHFAADVAQLRGDLESVRHRLAAAEDRLAHARAGGRLTDREAVSVRSRALAVATAVWNEVVYRRGTTTKADFNAALERAHAIERGMTALGYDLTLRREPDS